jgi:hypothetical protein
MCGVLRQQKPKRIDQAVGRIDRPTETKIGHVCRKGLSAQAATRKLPPKITQRRQTKIERTYPITTRGVTSRPVPQAGSSKCRTTNGQYVRHTASIKSASRNVRAWKAMS